MFRNLREFGIGRYLGLILLVSNTLVFTYIIGLAFVNDWVVTLNFNFYKEGWLELFLAFGLLPFALKVIYDEVRR